MCVRVCACARVCEIGWDTLLNRTRHFLCDSPASYIHTHSTHAYIHTADAQTCEFKGKSLPLRCRVTPNLRLVHSSLQHKILQYKIFQRKRKSKCCDVPQQKLARPCGLMTQFGTSPRVEENFQWEKISRH